MFTNKNIPTFHIDSEFRELNSVSSTNLNFKLQTDINSNFTHLALISSYIPKTWYVIDDGYDKFNIKEGANVVTVTVPIGNYNVLTLETVLNIAMNKVSTFKYVCEYSFLTNKYTWVVSNNAGVQPIFEFINNDKILDVLGFFVNQTFVSNTLTSTNQINLNHTKYLQLRSDIVDNAGNISEYETDILQRIPSHVEYGEVIEYNVPSFNSGLTKIKFNKSNIYNFRLLDEHDREINLHGNDWSFTMIMMKHDLPVQPTQIIDPREDLPEHPGSKVKEHEDREFSAQYKKN